MAITLKNYKDILGGEITSGRVRKNDADMIMQETWWNDIQAQTAYLYDYYHDLKSIEKFRFDNLHPEDDEMKTAIPIKFIRHQSQTFSKDNITYWLQLQPGQECNTDYYNDAIKKYHITWPVSLYIDIKDESGKYNKWLIVGTANAVQNQFPTFELLKVDYLAQWVYKGKKYECPAVLRSQSSYNSGLWTDYIVTRPEDQQILLIPQCEVTETLYYNIRMIIDNDLYSEDAEYRAWNISKINRISPNGICKITLAQDVFDQHKDYIERDENGYVIGKWADWFTSNIEPTDIDVEDNPSNSNDESQELTTSVLSCSGKPQIKIGGSAKTITARFYQSGEEIDAPENGFIFTIDGQDAATLLSIEALSENAVKIKFLGNDSYIGKILSIKNVSSEDNQIMSMLDIEIVPL